MIVPAHCAAHLLPDTLGALAASDLPRHQWELIVVDDASPDGTANMARRFADRVVALEGRPRGPGGARNEGARVARGRWIAFVDADVRVHPDALSRIARHVDTPGLVAVFGSYDNRPHAQGLVSEYRNLLHRYTHCHGAGDAETFWAGCGAVDRRAFEQVGGFDTVRFTRPQIEDIDLGYRLRDAGGRILLDPSIQGTHLKQWTFGGMLRTDLFDRGIPWMRLLLERRGKPSLALNTGRLEQLKVVLAAMAAVLLLAGVVSGNGMLAMASLACTALLLALNARTYRWFLGERGAIFTLAVIPLHLVYYLGNAVAAAAGIAQHLAARQRPVLVQA